MLISDETQISQLQPLQAHHAAQRMQPTHKLPNARQKQRKLTQIGANIHLRS
jgi:hypothetical protein